jgi:hypothetical protein
LCYSLVATINFNDYRKYVVSIHVTLKIVIPLLFIIRTYFKAFQYKIIIVKQYEFVELIIPKKYKVEPQNQSIHLKDAALQDNT